MLLVSFLKTSAPAALVFLAACASPPAPDIDDIQGRVHLGYVQDRAYYPHALVEEFKEFELELKPTEGGVLETAVIARVSWDIAEFDPQCEIAIAFRRTTNWYNYAWAGDGELVSMTPNWWGQAQERHPEIKDPPITDNALNQWDVFATARPVATGRALVAWYVRGALNAGDLANVQAYVAYGCNSNQQTAVTPIDVSAEATPSTSPTG